MSYLNTIKSLLFYLTIDLQFLSNFIQNFSKNVNFIEKSISHNAEIIPRKSINFLLYFHELVEVSNTIHMCVYRKHIKCT